MKAHPRTHPTCIPLPAEINSRESLEDYFKNHSSPILPPFPNWEKSFISGSEGPLVDIAHGIEKHLETEPPGPNRWYKTWSKIQFKPRAEGPPNHVHGGVSAGLIDELMGILVWHHGLMGVTKNLETHYWLPLPLNKTCFGVSEIVAVKERTVEVRTTLFVDGLPHVSGRAVFHRLTVDQLEKFRKSRSIA